MPVPVEPRGRRLLGQSLLLALRPERLSRAKTAYAPGDGQWRPALLIWKPTGPAEARTDGMAQHRLKPFRRFDEF